MRNFTELASVRSGRPAPFADQRRLAVAAYPASFQGSSRTHTDSGLRCSLSWCAKRGLDPLTARRPHLEPYLRWMQEIRPVKPSTVSRRFSVTAGFYRTRASDDTRAHSPAEHLRRPAVPAESPAPGLTHVPFEARAPRPASPPILATSPRWPCPGCLQIFEATGANIADPGEEHGHRVLRVQHRHPRWP